MAIFIAIMALQKIDFGHFWGPKHIEQSPVSTNMWIKRIHETWSKVKYSTQHYWWKKIAKAIVMAIMALENADFGHF